MLDDDVKILVVTIAALDFAKREVEDMRVLYPELDGAIDSALETAQRVLSQAGCRAEARIEKMLRAQSRPEELE